MAKEALELHLFGMEEDGDPIPVPRRYAKLAEGIMNMHKS